MTKRMKAFLGDKRIKNVIIAFFWSLALGRLATSDAGMAVADVALFAAFCVSLAFCERLNMYLKPSKKAMIFGGIVSLVLVIGDLIYRWHYLTGLAKHPIFYLLMFISLAHFCSTFVLFLMDLLIEAAKKENLFDINIRFTKVHAIVFLLVTFGLYLICLVTFWPGTATYDYGSSFFQATGVEPYSDHQPLFYTMIWKVFVTIADIAGNKFLANILYSVVQIIVVCGVCLFMLRWMERHKVPSVIVILSGIYFSLLPTFQLFAFAPTKDVYFMCALVLFLTGVYDAALSNKGVIRIIVGGLMAWFLRHNMVYVIVASLLILCILRIDNLRRIIVAVIPIVIVAVAVPRIVYPQIGVIDTEAAEYISVPIQQISAVYNHKGLFTEEEEDLVREFIPDVDDYNYRFADPVKNSFNNELYNEDSGKFWRLYLTGARKSIHIYVCAALDLNIQLWYPASTPIDPYADRAYVEADRYPGAEEYYSGGIFSVIRPFYEEIAHGTGLLFRLPIFKNYLSLSFPFWSICFCLFVAARRKSEKAAVMPIVLLLLIGTYMLGPVTIYRYMYPIYMMLPIYSVIAFYSKEIAGNNAI